MTLNDKAEQILEEEKKDVLENRVECERNHEIFISFETSPRWDGDDLCQCHWE